MMSLMSGLLSCSQTIRPKYEPILRPTILKDPKSNNPKDYLQVLKICMIERDALYRDFMRVQEMEKKLNRKWWELWK